MDVRALVEQKARGAREALAPAREPRRDERPQAQAHEVARQGLVGVALVLDPIQPACARIGDDRFARHLEERAHQQLRPEPCGRGHAARAAHACSAQQVHEHCLGLVVQLVRQRDRVGGRSPIDGMARLARRRLEPPAALRAHVDPALHERNAPVAAQRLAEALPAQSAEGVGGENAGERK